MNDLIHYTTEVCAGEGDQGVRIRSGDTPVASLSVLSGTEVHDYVCGRGAAMLFPSTHSSEKILPPMG
jgi:hypothetical protein